MRNTIRLTCADYTRVMPLAVGAVAPDNLPLELVLGKRGSWPDRAEMLRRALEDGSVHGGESSMGVHLARMGRGDRSFVALPIFVLRNFTARDLYVRKGSDIRTPKDLAGKRIGMYSWTASGSIFYRHFLDYIGIRPEDAQWTIGEIDGPSTPGKLRLPPGGQAAEPGVSVAQMLIDGKLDAMMSPPRPAAYHPVDGPIVRLFPDFRAIEQRYYRETGIFPPQHLVVLRRDVWEADKRLAKDITDAFVQCEAYFRAQSRSFPYLSPWFEADLEDSDRVIGDDAYAHGYEQNRATMQTFCDTGHRFGLTPHRVTVEDYFAEFLAS